MRSCFKIRMTSDSLTKEEAGAHRPLPPRVSSRKPTGPATAPQHDCCSQSCRVTETIRSLAYTQLSHYLE